MKKLFLVLLLTITALFLITGCSSKGDSAEPTIPLGTYVFNETDEPVGPNVVLEDNNQFVFAYSVLSSYLPIGSYEVDGDHLILKTDDGQYRYEFEIKDKTLTFLGDESSSITFGDVKDGSVFVMKEE